ncbi:sensor domain-containing diguanylate cyclase [Chitinibacteraceae bacterium HSL-7]
MILVLALVVAWVPMAWSIANTVSRRSAERYVNGVRERKARDLDLIGSQLADRWRYLRAAPELVAESPVVLRALARSESKVGAEANRFLHHVIERTLGDAIWVLDRDGRVLLCSDSGTPASLLGRNLAEDEFFRPSLNGYSSEFFGHGRMTDEPGFYFSAPIRSAGEVVAVAVVKVRTATLAQLFPVPNLLLANTDGVVVVSQNPALHWHTLPGADLGHLTPEKRALRYGDRALEPLDVAMVPRPETPWLREAWPAQLLVSNDAAKLDGLSLHYLASLDGLTHVLDQRNTLFGLIAGCGALALALIAALATYLWHIRRLGERLRFINLRLRQQADSDPLTQCANRRHFMRRLETELSRSERYGSALTLAMIDIDFFKRINDEYGHAAGDAGLVYLVESIQSQIRSEDLLGRLGGEEFALLLPDTTQAAAGVLLERLRSGFETGGFTDHGRRITFTVSQGVAGVLQGENARAFLARADEALYVAKRTGRNRVCRAVAELKAAAAQTSEPMTFVSAFAGAPPPSTRSGRG